MSDGRCPKCLAQQIDTSGNCIHCGMQPGYTYPEFLDKYFPNQTPVEDDRTATCHSCGAVFKIDIERLAGCSVGAVFRQRGEEPHLNPHVSTSRLDSDFPEPELGAKYHL